jgi:hypothetical protein
MPMILDGSLGTVSGLGVPAPGLVLVASQTFAAQSSVSLDGCFTSAYDNYRVVVRLISSVSNENINYRLRAAGVDNSAAVYQSANTSNPFTASALAKEYQTNGTSLTLRRQSNTAPSTRWMEVSAPALAEYTHFEWSGSDASAYSNHGHGLHAAATAYDGFTIYPGSGTITGVTYVYAYNDVVGAAEAFTVPPSQGLVHITTQTLNASASVSVNGCFTSDYENYRMVFKGACSAASSGANVRMRAAGVDATGTDYVNQIHYTQNNTNSRLYTSNGQALMTVGWILGGTLPLSAFDVSIYAPAVAAVTGFSGTGVARDGVTYVTSLQSSGGHMLATAYDGFTLYPDSGTLTGTLSVYGYEKGA